MAKKRPPPIPVSRPVVKVVSIEHLVPTSDNRRCSFDEAALAWLAASIRQEGIIHPIIVRRHPTLVGRWEIRAGERRWRAAMLAGLKQVPVIVRKLDDPSALALTLSENLQRQDLHPLEEAETIQLAFDRGYDVKAIASMVGKTIQYVTRRASLTRLTKIWREALHRADGEVSRLSPAHLELIARLPEATQKVWAEDGFSRLFGGGFPTVEQLRKMLDEELRSLTVMPWPINDETLEPKAGACVTCPKRSSQQPMLFDELAVSGKTWRDDRCLDPQCFDRKQVAYLRRCETTLRQKHPDLRVVQVGFAGLGRAITEAFGAEVGRVYHPTVVKAGDPQAIPVMPLDGPKAGRLVFLAGAPDRVEEGARRSSRSRDANGKPVPLTLGERRMRLHKRRDALVVKQVTERLQSIDTEAANSIVARWAQTAHETTDRLLTVNPLALVLAFGTSTRANRADEGDAWVTLGELREAEPTRLTVSALLAVLPIWLGRLTYPSTHAVSAQAEDARHIADLIGMDAAKLDAEAVEAIPEPRCWAKEAADPASSITDEVSPADETARQSRVKQGHKRKKNRAA